MRQASADRLDLGELAAPAKHVEKSIRLAAHAAKLPELEEDDAPRGDREEKQEQEDGPGERTGAGNEAENVSLKPALGRADALHLLKSKGIVAKRAQPSLREI